MTIQHFYIEKGHGAVKNYRTDKIAAKLNNPTIKYI